MERIYICLPVCNEEKRLEICLKSINNAILSTSNCEVKTFICLNNCLDKSKGISEDCIKKYPKLNIEILMSKGGKSNAQEKTLSKVAGNKKIFFIDADTEVDKKSIEIILREFNKHKELIAIGAFPVAKKYSGPNLWQSFLDNVLNIRSRHPMAEISKLDVRDYHRLAIKDPQTINTNAKHEIRSKIFLHGRMFALRSKKYWNKPSRKKCVAGDDTYLLDYINCTYGKNRVRMRYDAIVYFEPSVSLITHYKVYKRIYFDIKNLKKGFPEFRDVRNHSTLILDKEYIRSQNLKTRFYFFCFILIRMIEKFLFKFSKEKNPHNIWKK